MMILVILMINLVIPMQNLVILMLNLLILLLILLILMLNLVLLLIVLISTHLDAKAGKRWHPAWPQGWSRWYCSVTQFRRWARSK